MIRRIAFAILLLATPVVAQDLATGEVIRNAVSDNTVQGSMTSSGVYTEFYAADGTIKGQDYQGQWTVVDDTMCFAYGEDDPTCFEVRLDGDQITWVEDGADTGTGTILPSNPNDF
jgi:hypothetical protein